MTADSLEDDVIEPHKLHEHVVEAVLTAYQHELDKLNFSLNQALRGSKSKGAALDRARGLCLTGIDPDRPKGHEPRIHLAVSGVPVPDIRSALADTRGLCLSVNGTTVLVRRKAGGPWGYPPS